MIMMSTIKLCTYIIIVSLSWNICFGVELSLSKLKYITSLEYFFSYICTNERKDIKILQI